MPSLNFPWCNVRSLPLVLSLVTWEKGQTPPDLQLQRVIESPMRLIFSRLNIPSKLSCSLQDLSFRPFTSFIAPLRTRNNSWCFNQCFPNYNYIKKRGNRSSLLFWEVQMSTTLTELWSTSGLQWWGKGI